LQIIKITRQL